jgi:hypothetical protein
MSLRDPALDVGARLLVEFDALRGISPLGLVLWLTLVIAVALGLAWGGPAIVRVVWRLGLDPRRRLGLVASALRVAGLFVGVAGCLRPVFTHAPTLGIGISVLGLALAGLVAPMQLRNLASGLALATRSRLREGDLVTIGALEGTVRDIGLLRISLRTIDGGLTWVPASELDREAVTVGSRRAAIPIEARVVVGQHLDERTIERLRRALWLSPYRRANTDPRVTLDAEAGRVDVRIDTWTASSTVEVERHLRALLLDITSPAERAEQAEREPAPEPEPESQELES